MLYRSGQIWIAEVFGQSRHFVDFVSAQLWIDHVKGAKK